MSKVSSFKSAESQPCGSTASQSFGTQKALQLGAFASGASGSIGDDFLYANLRENEKRRELTG